MISRTGRVMCDEEVAFQLGNARFQISKEPTTESSYTLTSELSYS
jgi:hypothetical protein